MTRKKKEEQAAARKQAVCDAARASMGKELGIFTGRTRFLYEELATHLDHGAVVEAQMLPNGQVRISNIIIKKKHPPARRWKFVPESRMRVFPIETTPTGEDGYRTVVAIGAWCRQWFYFELQERPEEVPARRRARLGGRWDEEANAFMQQRRGRSPFDMFAYVYGSGESLVRFSEVGGLMLPITREAARAKLAPALGLEVV